MMPGTGVHDGRNQQSGDFFDVAVPAFTPSEPYTVH